MFIYYKKMLMLTLRSEFNESANTGTAAPDTTKNTSDLGGIRSLIRIFEGSDGKITPEEIPSLQEAVNIVGKTKKDLAELRNILGEVVNYNEKDGKFTLSSKEISSTPTAETTNPAVTPTAETTNPAVTPTAETTNPAVTPAVETTNSKVIEAEKAKEAQRKAKVNSLIKKYRKGNYEYKGKDDGVDLLYKEAKRLYDIAMKPAHTSWEDINAFEKAMSKLDKLQTQQVIEVDPIDTETVEVKKYSPEVQAVFDKLNSKKPYGDNNKFVLGHITTKTDNPVKVAGKVKHVKLNQSEVDDYNKIVDQKNSLNTKRKEIEDSEPSFLEEAWDKLTSTEKKENLSEIQIASSEEFEKVLGELAKKKPYGPDNKFTIPTAREKSTFRVKTSEGKYKSVKLSTEKNITIDEKKYSQLSLYNEVIKDKNALNTKRKIDKQKNSTSVLDSITDMFSSSEDTKRSIATDAEVDAMILKMQGLKPKTLKTMNPILLRDGENVGYKTRNVERDGKKVKVVLNSAQAQEWNNALLRSSR